MALIVPLTIPAYYKEENGEVVTVPAVEYPAAYARLLTVRALSGESYLLVSWYADEAARFADAQPVKLYEYSLPTADLKGDVYPAAYAYLKALPEFAGAADHPVVDPDEVIAPVEPAVVEPAPEPAIVEPAPEPTQAPAEA